MNLILTYTAFNSKGEVIKDGTFLAKNSRSEFDTKIKFEAFMRKKHPEMSRIQIECQPENFMMDFFNKLFNPKS